MKKYVFSSNSLPTRVPLLQLTNSAAIVYLLPLPFPVKIALWWLISARVMFDWWCILCEKDVDYFEGRDL